MLKEMGISAIGDLLAILQHAKVGFCVEKGLSSDHGTF